MEETVFSNPDASADGSLDLEDIDAGRPSLQERSLNRASMRRRQSRRPTTGEYGTFENAAFSQDSLEPDMVETTFSEDEGPSHRETTALRFQQNHKKVGRMDQLQSEWKQFCLKVKDAFSIFEVSQRIQCFGGGVFSYFSFVSWVGKLNFFTAVLYLAALILPYGFIGKPDQFNQTIPFNGTPEWRKAAVCSNEYKLSLKNYIDSRSTGQIALDILQGTGLMENSPFIFIGSYIDKILWQSSKYPDVRYDASLAFYLCLWVTLALSLIVTIFESGKKILKRVNVREEKSRFTFKTLSRWDFMIQDKRRAKIEQRNIQRELKTALAEEDRVKRKNEMSTTQKRLLKLKRMIAWFIYLILLAGCLTGIYFANIKSLELSKTLGEDKDDKNFDTDDMKQLFYQYMPSLVIVVANGIVAFYCRKIVAIEEYGANREIIVTIWRTVILKFASVGVLMFSIFDLLRNCVTVTPKSCVLDTEKCNNLRCWETYIGQQFYKLILLDWIVFLLFTVTDILRKYIGKKISFIGKSQFDIANYVLDLIYSQTLCWLGMFFCPLLPIVNFVKIILLYILRKLFVTFHVYEHDAKSANAAQTDSYFLDVLLFILVFMVALPMAVSISIFVPSQGCGPYRVSNDNENENKIQHKALIHLPETAKSVYDVIKSLLFLVPLWTFIVFIGYIFYTLTQARKQRKKALMQQMVLAMKDLVFCRNQAKSALRGAQLARRAQVS